MCIVGATWPAAVSWSKHEIKLRTVKAKWTTGENWSALRTERDPIAPRFPVPGPSSRAGAADFQAVVSHSLSSTPSFSARARGENSALLSGTRHPPF
eukprot:2042774-Pyramimonas_sp.AAC.1